MIHETRERAQGLVEYGLPDERLARFPAEQIILLDERREYEVRRDDLMKLMHLPVWQMEALAGQAKPAPEPILFDLHAQFGHYYVRETDATAWITQMLESVAAHRDSAALIVEPGSGSQRHWGDVAKCIDSLSQCPTDVTVYERAAHGLCRATRPAARPSHGAGS